jgi:hypothetical protein
MWANISAAAAAAVRIEVRVVDFMAFPSDLARARLEAAA